MGPSDPKEIENVTDSKERRSMFQTFYDSNILAVTKSIEIINSDESYEIVNSEGSDLEPQMDRITKGDSYNSNLERNLSHASSNSSYGEKRRVLVVSRSNEIV